MTKYILVVDKRSSVGNYLHDLQELNTDFEPLTASNFIAAIELLHKHAPSIAGIVVGYGIPASTCPNTSIISSHSFIQTAIRMRDFRGPVIGSSDVELCRTEMLESGCKEVVVQRDAIATILKQLSV